MGPSLSRSENDLIDPGDGHGSVTAGTLDRELLTVSQELNAIFATALSGLAGGSAAKFNPKRPLGRRAVLSGGGGAAGRRALIAAGVGAGFFGLCLGALMEKSVLMSGPQAHDAAAMAAVVLAPTPLPPTPLPQTSLAPTLVAPTPEIAASSVAAGTPTFSSPPPISSLTRKETAANPPARADAPVHVAAAEPLSVLRSKAASRPPRRPLSLAMLAAAPLPTAPSPAQRPPLDPEPVAPLPPVAAAPLHAQAQAASTNRPFVRCDWRRICGPTAAVMQADGRLRQAYSAAARAGVNPDILERFRQNWAEMRYALGNQPPQLLNGYRQLTESLWQARRSTLSGQYSRLVDDGSERDYGGPPE